ncbi:MAG: ABC transporter ATP-binding protein, partial [Gammaproteobacteria bacterium]|nr:ABC transporter ATP-binding protein [Gammaproteobacteria bacterium]
HAGKVADLLEIVGLQGFGKRYPHELSGGQQQRVALARALAAEPQIILLDEPFSNLDIELREKLSLEVKDILSEQNITAILVTHDQAEAFAVSDAIAVIHEGKLQQWDSAYNLYHDPVNRFVADFIGQGVFLKGELVSPDAVKTELGTLRGDRAYTGGVGSFVDVLIRPDDILPDEQSPLRVTVTQKAFRGSDILYTLKMKSGTPLLASFPSHYNHYVGEEIGINPDIQHLIAFDEQ